MVCCGTNEFSGPQDVSFGALLTGGMVSRNATCRARHYHISGAGCRRWRMKGEERVKNNDGHNSNNHTAGPQMEVAGDPLCIRSIQVKKPRKRGKKLVCLYKRSRSSLILAQGIGHKVGPQRSIIPPAFFSPPFAYLSGRGPGASCCFFCQKI